MCFVASVYDFLERSGDSTSRSDFVCLKKHIPFLDPMTHDEQSQSSEMINSSANYRQKFDSSRKHGTNTKTVKRGSMPHHLKQGKDPTG